MHVIGKPLGRLGNLQVEFDWPREVSNGKWLLYLEEIRLEGTSEARCDPPGDIVNPLNLEVTIATSACHFNKGPGPTPFKIKACPIRERAAFIYNETGNVREGSLGLVDVLLIFRTYI